jgi:hypothetical protein
MWSHCNVAPTGVEETDVTLNIVDDPGSSMSTVNTKAWKGARFKSSWKVRYAALVTSYIYIW